MATRRYLTPDEVCARYEVKRQTLYNWRATGRGPRATKIGAQLRYAEEDLEEYERAGRDGAAAA